MPASLRLAIQGRPATPVRLLLVLAIMAAVAITAFMTVGARGNWDFVLPFRGRKILALVLVGYAIAVSTVLFQTITGNRILTPSIMGFDALYVLIQTTLVFFVGAGRVSSLPAEALFAFETALMVGFAAVLYRWMFAGGLRSLHLLLLVGIVCGILFRSLSGFMQRVIDPNEFVVLQDRLFASFNAVDGTLLGVSFLLIAGASVVCWRIRDRFDVLALGREAAISLGVDHRRTVAIVLALVAVLVSASTALVGPVTFFGLLVANLAYMIMSTHRHSVILPAAALIAVTLLVGGQVVLERIFGFDTALSVIIEFIGGLAFIALVVRGAAR